VLVLLLLFQAGQGQYFNLHFQNFNSSNGLPGNDVECLYQDSRGFIWAGTRFGLSMFDGTNFRNFLHDPLDSSSLGGTRIFKMQEDKAGSLWVASENFGLSRIDLKTLKVRNFPIPANRQLEDRYINTLFIDKKGQIWIGAETGISYFNPVTERYVKVEVQALPGNKEIVAFAEDKMGILWAIEYSGQIFYKRPNEKIFTALVHDISVGYVHDVVEFSDKSFLLATSNGIFDLQLNPEVQLSTVKKSAILRSTTPITNLAVDKNGTLWIANQLKGIQLYYKNTSIPQDLNISWLSPLEPGIAIWKDIMMDREGGIWLGGEFGLYHYNSNFNQFNVYKAIAKLHDQYSLGRYVGLSSSDNHVITVAHRGISIFDRSGYNFVSMTFAPGLDKNEIQYFSILQLSPNRWWLSTSVGVLELIKRVTDYILLKPTELQRDPILGNALVYSIARSANGNFWFATPENGLLSYDTKTKAVQQYLDFGKGATKKTIAHLDIVASSDAGDIVVGHHRGFAIKFHNEKEFIHIEQLVNQSFDFSKLSVYDLAFVGGFLWVGSEGDGLLSFDFKKKRLKVFTINDGLVSNSITSIHAMRNSKMLIGTNRGMSIMHIPTGTFTTFLKKDGLPSEEFEICVDHDIDSTEFFMATTKGVISFFDRNLRQSIIKPKLMLYAVSRNGKVLNDSLVYQLRNNPVFTIKYNENLNLEFSALNFSNDNDFILRFKMKDDADWNISNTSKSLSLFNLDAGNYDITVQLMGKRSGIMSDQFKVKLEVLPSFFKTRLFRVMLLFVILALLFFPVNRYFKRKLLKQKRELEKKQILEQERVRIAMDLHDDIGGNLTALTLMTGLLKDKEVDPSRQLLFEKIGEASDKMVQDMNEIVWALNITNDSLISLMSYIRQYVSSRLSASGINLDISEPLTYPDMFVSGRTRRNIFMVIKEVINNALKYAGTKKIDITIVLDDNLRIIISDNGIGMPDKFTHQTIKGGGNGVNNIRKRVDMLSASILFKNEKGLTVVFDMPLKNFENKE
jgi:ligand-binding sensor domain-containing protein/signal transduction histidine kinase